MTTTYLTVNTIVRGMSLAMLATFALTTIF